MNWDQNLLINRPRRLRKNSSIRDLVQENILSSSDFVYPLFVSELTNTPTQIDSMPGQYRWDIGSLSKIINDISAQNIKGVALFPCVKENKKDPLAKESYNKDGLLFKVIQLIKKLNPELLVITDVAMDPYSSDGHDGLVKNGEILNDETLEILGKMALIQAQFGADFIAPSDMMDGRVGYLRNVLDSNSFHNVGIISYSAKYASSFYGPFREALDSNPATGDKKTYQMDPANCREALKELLLDQNEGADVLMIKPALAYLDIIKLAKESTHCPIAAYNVSGEYSMIKAAAERGWLNEKNAALESLLSIKRSGADIIFTYWALQASKWLKEF